MNPNQPYKNYQDDSFDGKLGELAHYKLYPQMMPFVGSHFSRMNKRVMVIGESHYLPKDSTISGNEGDKVANWYTGRVEELSEEEKIWINTRITAGGDSKPKGHAIYRQLKHALRESLGEDRTLRDNPFRAIAFYNYFQRPAKTGDSLIVTDLDRNVAYDHLLALKDILGVTHFAFVSKLAYNAFWKRHGKDEFSTRDIFGAAHPSSSWWNRPHRHIWWGEQFEMTSREWFMERVGELVVDS